MSIVLCSTIESVHAEGEVCCVNRSGFCGPSSVTCVGIIGKLLLLVLAAVSMAESTRYGTTISDASATVGLTGMIVDLVHRPVSAFWTKRTQKQMFIKRLGQWAGEAFDEHEHWLQPVLQLDAFETHLVQSDGCFQPSGKCSSSLAWAQLLYALGINPGMGVLAWRLSPQKLDPTETGTIDLEIDGGVLVHIVNLYTLYSYDDSYGFRGSWLDEPPHHNDSVGPGSTDAAIVIRLKFGRLKFQPSSPDKRICNFEPGVEKGLRARREPFDLHRSERFFEPGTVAAKYFQTLEHGVSDSIRTFPSPTAPIETRVSALLLAWSKYKLSAEASQDLSGIQRRSNYNENTSTQSSISQCTLYTRSWFEEASRIKRRVTSNGGTDDTLSTCLATAVRELPISLLVAVSPKLTTTNEVDANELRQAAKFKVGSQARACIMAGDASFKFIEEDRMPIKSLTFITQAEKPLDQDELRSLLIPAVQSCIDQQTQPWATIWAPLTPASIVDVLEIPQSWPVSRFSAVLPLTKGSKLWEMECTMPG